MHPESRLIPRPSQSRLNELGEWFTAEYPDLLRFAYFLVANRQESEDLVQEAFVRIYRAGPKVSPPGFRAYARRTVLNLARSGFRRRRRELVALARMSLKRNKEAVDSPTRVDVRRALVSLPVLQRACLAMRFYDGLKEREIADALEMSLSAVKKQVERGLKALAVGLDEGESR